MTGRGNSSTVSLVVFSSTSVGHICQVSTLHFFSIFSRTPFTLLTTAARHPGLHFMPSPGTVRAFTDIHSCNFLPECLCSAFRPSMATSSHSWKCSPSPLHVLLGFIQNKILASHEISCFVWHVSRVRLYGQGHAVLWRAAGEGNRNDYGHSCYTGFTLHSVSRV